MEEEEERNEEIGGKEITIRLPGISAHSWHLLREVDTHNSLSLTNIQRNNKLIFLENDFIM